MFSQLKRFESGADDVARMPVPEMGPDAWIEGRPANESNPRYFDAQIRKLGRAGRDLARGNVLLTADQIRRFREVDRDLFPDLVWTAWGGFVDERGKPVECTPENRKEFARQCPWNLMDRIRDFFSSPLSFERDGMPAPPDPDDVAGNSPPGSSGS